MGKNRKKESSKKSNRSLIIVLLIFIVVVPVSVYFINEQSKPKTAEDANKNPYDEGTSAFYDWEAAKRIEPLAKDMMKTPSPYKFIKDGIDEVEDYCWQALDLDTTFTSSWEKLGYIYAFMHGKQSLLILKSAEEGETSPEELLEKRAEVARNFIKAELYYNKALEFGSKDSAGVYYALANAAKLQLRNDHVVLNLQKAFKMEPDNKKYESELIEAYMYAGLFNQALAQNELFKKKYPKHEFSYRTLGSYYYYKGEEEVGIYYYEQAAELGSKPEVGMLLHKHFIELGDTTKANYYLEKVYEARANYRPE